MTVTGKGCGFVNVILGAAAPWHTDVVPLIDAVGVGLTVTSAVTGPAGPPHPFALTLIVAIPLNDELKTTVAVVPVPVTVLPAPVAVQL